MREAACQCIAELSAKVSPTVVEPHVDVLLETLIECFQDESWPVRDMACVACGSFVSAFPGIKNEFNLKLVCILGVVSLLPFSAWLFPV